MSVSATVTGRPLAELGEWDDQMIDESIELLAALHEVEHVASTETTVLLLGETGTGKELFARALHDGSKRSDKPKAEPATA